MPKAKVQEPTPTGSALNIVKWVLILGMLTTSVGANYYYAYLPNSQRMIGWLIVALALLALTATTNQGKVFLAFAKEAQVEIQKVVWPTKQETMQTTFIVLAMVLFMGIVLWIMDYTFLWAVGVLTGQKG